MIRPDYSLCVDDIYTQVAKRSIETTQSFRILAHAGFRQLSMVCRLGLQTGLIGMLTYE